MTCLHDLLCLPVYTSLNLFVLFFPMYSNELEEYSYATVLTNIPIKDNQLFEVELMKMIKKWSWSLVIGFTTHAPDRIEFPEEMGDMTSGTWLIRMNEVLYCEEKIKELGCDIDDLVVSRCAYSKNVH